MTEVDPRFEAWLSLEAGIDAPALGAHALERAVLDRTRAMLAESPSHRASVVNAAALDAYWLRLNTWPEERQALIEALVVPETWFFRDREAFAELARLAGERLAREPARVLRILSVACSTGEEPYSAAMALLDAGIAAARFAIDAIDISGHAIAHAEHALYGRSAFRGHSPAFRDRYFSEAAGGWQLREGVRRRVRFAQGDLFEDAAAGEVRYDFIFCRNVLTYFHRDAQDRAIQRLDAQLADGGTIFVGPAETGPMMRHAMTPSRIPLAFAFVRQPASKTLAHAVSPSRQVPLPAAAGVSAAAPARPPASVPVRGGAGVASVGAARPSGAAVPVSRSTPLPMPPLRKAFPDLDDAHRLADAGRFDEAERIIQDITSLSAPEADTFYLLGVIAQGRGRPADAGDFYRKTLYLDPSHYEALTHLAALLDVGGDVVGARQLMLRAQRAMVRRDK
ncbi:CheR family methyltransferase [Ralstonia solanacearum]|uniref:CheR family methyltransferase n=2 Tax=Ralstonia solanacearum TaxID=305 RepID=UPI00044B2F5E|nr:CheR family methyltransferase [Ralstonia solanacearum]EUJ11897.1 methyltransferase [Ralstonia solanacearum P673]MCL9845966.1 methyltransferase domain-containing protein [Ralstonia solanacearum]MCL9854490.1 methyltransferase domain-containing protein [Ralstonia solanacearum]MCL9859491.1 methyltransferase domain-containing protein [Ralstonia solanacearum]MCL9865281.1 methyltransferase domain-containing protein [Ralstonia solanacearum]